MNHHYSVHFTFNDKFPEAVNVVVIKPNGMVTSLRASNLSDAMQRAQKVIEDSAQSFALHGEY